VILGSGYAINKKIDRFCNQPKVDIVYMHNGNMYVKDIPNNQNKVTKPEMKSGAPEW